VPESGTSSPTKAFSQMLTQMLSGSLCHRNIVVVLCFESHFPQVLCNHIGKERERQLPLCIAKSKQPLLGRSLLQPLHTCLQVQQHHEKLQIEREEAAILKLQSSLPKICHPVLAVALKDCAFDADRALLMLRQFQSDAFDELALIRKRRRAEASRSSHEVFPDSGPGGDRGRRRRDSRHKHKKSSKSKKDKRKRSKQKHTQLSDSPDSGEEERALEFGSFGIIRESDYTLKKPEFAAWASEVQHIDIESLPRCVLPCVNERCFTAVRCDLPSRLPMHACQLGPTVQTTLSGVHGMNMDHVFFYMCPLPFCFLAYLMLCHPWCAHPREAVG
jgi:hypothetical protein